MDYKELARKIKEAYQDLKKDERYKFYNIIWNPKLETAEISVENDAEFKAIIIGNTRKRPKSRGFMYLFYTGDRKVPFPSIKEIERRLKLVADKETLSDKDACYFDWEEFGSLEKQRVYFSKIIQRAVTDEKDMRNKNRELEFTDAMLERTEEMDYAIYHMCLALLRLEDKEDQFPWDVGILEEIKESVLYILRKNHYKTCDPYIKEEDEKEEYCSLENCGFTECNRHP